MGRKQKRGQPNNAGQFASNTSGRYAPTASNLPSGLPTLPQAKSTSYDAAYRRFTYQPAGIGDDYEAYFTGPSKFTQWRRRLGLTTRSATNSAVRVTQMSHRGTTVTIEEHPSPVLVATSAHVPNLVDPRIKEKGRFVAVVTDGPGQSTLNVRWIACRGKRGTTEGGDAEFVGRTRDEVLRAIREQIDWELDS